MTIAPLLFEEVEWTVVANLALNFETLYDDLASGIFDLVGGSGGTRSYSDGRGGTYVFEGIFSDGASTITALTYSLDGTDIATATLSANLRGPVADLADILVPDYLAVTPTIFNGGARGDVVKGTTGADCFFGKGGNDSLRGGRGDELALGGGGNDHLDGGAGDDDLRGNVGNDLIYGNRGIDKAMGGAGADCFVFAPNQDRTVVRDFSADDLLLAIGLANPALPAFTSAADAVSGTTLADLTPADLATLGISVRETATGHGVVMSGGTTMVLRGTGLDAVGLDQLYLSETGLNGAVAALNDATGLGFISFGAETTI